MFESEELFREDNASWKENVKDQMKVVCSMHRHSISGKRSSFVGRGAQVNVNRDGGDQWELQMKASIRVACWNTNGTCIVIGDDNGSIHFVNHLGVNLFSYKMIEENQKFEYLKLVLNAEARGGVNSDNTDDIIIVTSNPSRMIVIRKLCISDIEDAVAANSFALLKSIRDSIERQIFDIDIIHPNGIASMVASTESHSGCTRVVLAGIGPAASLSCWTCTRMEPKFRLLNSLSSYDMSPIVSVDLIGKLDKIVVGVSDNGQVNVWDCESMMHLKTLDIESAPSKQRCVAVSRFVKNSQVALLYQSDAESSLVVAECHLRRPCLNVYTFSHLSPTARIISIAGDRKYLFLLHQTQNELELVGSLFMESSAQKMLAKHLADADFEKAARIIEDYDLDVSYQERLYRCQLASILQAVKQSPTGIQEDLVEDSLQKLSKLTATNPKQYVAHVVEGCIGISVSSICDQRRVLVFADSILTQYHDTLMPETAQILETKMHEAKRRFETFEMIRSPDAVFDPAQWHAFRNCSMREQVSVTLQNGRLNMASCMWSRHCQTLSTADTIQLLCEIPTYLPLALHLSWISSRIALKSLGLADRLKLVERACELLTNVLDEAESVDSRFTFAENMYKLCSFGVTSNPPNYKSTPRVEFASTRQSLQGLCSLNQKIPQHHFVAKLHSFVLDLQNLQYLRDSHKLVLTLSQFRDLSTEETVHLLLRRVPSPELVQEHVHLHVEPCAARFDLETDTVCVSFVRDASKEFGACHKEEYLVAVIRCIKQQSLKAKTVLYLMQNVLPPFGEEIQHLVQEASNWETEYRDEIQEQWHVLQLRVLVTKFNVESVNFSSSVHTKALLMYILANSKYQTELLHDCLKVIRAFNYVDIRDIFSVTLENLILDLNWPADEVATVVQNVHNMMLENHLDEYSLRDITQKALMFAELTAEEEDDLEQRIHAYRVAASIAHYMGAYVVESDSRELLESRYYAVATLQQEYNILTHPDELESKKEDMFQKHVLEQFNKRSIVELLRIAALLGFDSADHVLGKLSLYALRNQDSSRGFQWTASISKPSNGSWLGLMAIELIMQKNVAREHFQKIQEILVEGVSSCTNPSVPRIVELIRNTSLMCDILDSCHFESDWETSSVDRSDQALNASEYHFRDYASILDPARLAPLALRFLIALESARSHSCVSIGGGALVKSNLEALMQYLNQNSAFQLSLRCWGVTDLCVFSSDISTLQSTLNALSSKVLTAPSIDRHLAFGYLIAQPGVREAQESYHASLPKMNDDYKRVEIVGAIGTAFAEYFCLAELFDDCSRMQNNAGWWICLRNLKVPFEHPKFCKPVGDTTRSYFREILRQLVVQSSFDFDLCLRFSQAYGISDDLCKGIFLTILLESSSYSHEQMRVFESVARTAKPAILLQIFEHSWKKIDGKDYTRLRALCNALSYSFSDESQARIVPKIQKYSLILDILEAHSRVSNAQCTDFLDFHSLTSSNPWPCLKTYLNVQNIKWLVALGRPLGIDSDDFYLYMIRKTAESKVSSCVWNVVENLLDRVNKKERVLEAIDWIAKRTMEDEVKLKMLEYGYQYVAEQDADRAEIYRNGIAWCKSRIQLITALGNQVAGNYLDETDASRLIMKLYEELSHAVNKSSLAHGYLHQLADDIGSRHAIDIDRLRQQLTIKWLEATIDQDSMTTKDSATNAAELDACMELRLEYLLTKNIGELGRIQGMLIRYATDAQVPIRSYKSRARALRVLLRISGDGNLPLITLASSSSDIDIFTYCQYALYMVDIEEMKLPYTLEQLMQCDKLGFVRALWRDHRTSTRAIRLISTVIMDFGLAELKLVNAVHRQMISLRMFPELFTFANVMEQAGIRDEDTQKILMEGVSAALTEVLSVREKDASLPHLAQNLLEMVTQYVTISEVFSDQNKISIAESLVHAGSMKFAFQVTMSIVDILERKQCFRTLIAGDTALISHLLNMFSFSNDTPSTMLIYDLVDDGSYHSMLLDSPYFEPFVSYLITRNRIGNLLRACADSGRDVESAQVSEEWVKSQNIETDSPLQHAMTYFNISSA